MGSFSTHGDNKSLETAMVELEGLQVTLAGPMELTLEPRLPTNTLP